MNKIIEPGWWNGLPAKITCCMIEVIPNRSSPMMWFNVFSGQTRQAVEVIQDNTMFLIDNQHGEGFYKVTKGLGSPSCGSKFFGEVKFLEYIEPEYWNRIFDEPQLAGERFIIEEYQERTNPEEFKKVKALVQGLRKFQSMTPDEQIDHIRMNMMPKAIQDTAPRPNFPPGGPPRKFTSPASKQHHSVHKKDGKGKR